MKNAAGHHRGWMIVLALGLGALAGLWILFPVWHLPASRPRPLPPQVIYRACAKAIASGQNELYAVWSPALIALPMSTLRPAALKDRVDQIQPPLEMPTEPPLFGKRNGLPPLPDHGPQAGDSRLSRENVAAIGSLPEIESAAKIPAPVKPTAPVNLACRGELKNRVPSALALEPWMPADRSWTLTVRVRVNPDGEVTRAILETPTADAALNAAVIRFVYQSRVARADQPAEDQVTLTYSGHGF